MKYKNIGKGKSKHQCHKTSFKVPTPKTASEEPVSGNHRISIQ
jgi:hypothetical protein